MGNYIEVFSFAVRASTVVDSKQQYPLCITDQQFKHYQGLVWKLENFDSAKVSISIWYYYLHPLHLSDNTIAYYIF